MPIVRVVAEVVRGAAVVGANVFHASLDGSNDTSDVNVFISDLGDFYTALAGMYTGDSTINVGGVVATVGEDPNYFVPATTVSVDCNGSNTAQPNNSAAIVTWRTGLAGRSYRGRTYLGPFANGTTDGNGTNLPSANQDAIQAAADDLVTASATSAQYSLVVWSEKLQSGTVVTAGQCRDYLASQRGRL